MPQAWNLTRFSPHVAEDQKLDPQRVTAGAWIDLEGIGKKLENIARNIDPGAPALADVKSVPDPWAHPRTFAEAVLEKGHPIHATCRGHWRWLLAVIGLSGIRKHLYTVEFTAMDLGAAVESPSSRIFADLAPKRTLWRKLEATSQGTLPLAAASWSRPILVRLVSKSGQVQELGLLNPCCLISSGRRFSELKPDVSPGWMAAGIDDPTASLTGNEKRILSRYLHDLRQSLGAQLGSMVDTDWGKLRTQLSEFIDDCGDPGMELTAGEHAQFDNMPGLYRPLLSIPEDEQELSDCLIAGTNLLLADPMIANSLGRRKDEVYLWKTITLAEIEADPGLIETIAPIEDGVRIIPQHEFRIVTTDQLLAERLCALKGVDIEPLFPRHGPTLQHFALPIQPIAFQFVEPADIPASLRRDELRVELTVPIGAPGQAVAHRVIKDFPRTDTVICQDYQISIWPDFRHAEWANYLARLRQPIDIGQPDKEYLQPFDILSLKRAPTRFVAPAALEKVAIKRSSEPIDVILCASRSGGSGSGAPQYAGLLLLSEAKGLPDDPTRGVKVAVDFGTTGTVAMAKGDSAPIAFLDRVLHPLGVSDKTRTALAWNMIHFFPLASATAADHVAQRMPVLSSWLRNDSWPAEGDPPVRGAPLFLPRHQIGEITTLVDLLGQIMSNLKWSEQMRETALRYLARLGLMIRAELAASGRHVDRWVFTHPRSLGEEKLRLFKQDIGQIFANMVGQAPPTDERELNDFIAEQVAFRCEDEACALSTFDAGDAGDTTIILDIGGRTTDTTFIQRAGRNQGGYRRLWQGSLRVAGMSFFTKPVTEDRSLLKWLGLEPWGAVLDGVGDPELRSFRLELLMAGPTLDEQLQSKWAFRDEKKDADRDVQSPHVRLEVTTLTFLAGMAWYLGSIATKVGADSEMLKEVNFRLCGRGARFPLRLNETATKVLVQRALGLFHHAAHLPGVTSVRGGGRPPKEEVVSGILIDQYDRKLFGGDASTKLYHVAAVSAGEKKPESAADPFEVLPTIGAEAIETFLKYLRDQVGVVIETDRLADRIRDLPSRDGNNLREEPAFIVCLRWLVETIADPGACAREGISFRIEQPVNS